MLSIFTKSTIEGWVKDTEQAIYLLRKLAADQVTQGWDFPSSAKGPSTLDAIKILTVGHDRLTTWLRNQEARAAAKGNDRAEKGVTPP